MKILYHIIYDTLLNIIFVDGGYTGKLVQCVEQMKAFVLCIVKRTDKGFIAVSLYVYYYNYRA